MSDKLQFRGITSHAEISGEASEVIERSRKYGRARGPSSRIITVQGLKITLSKLD